MKLIGCGAEAEVYLEKATCKGKTITKIVKKRIQKDYRIKEIDIPIRRFRTKREAKVLEKAIALNIPVPKVILVDKDKMEIEMEEIAGLKLRDKLNTLNYLKLSRELGGLIATLHNNDIIHGDLTTSNMVYESKKKKIFLIDFGLSFFSEKVEDKAVDIHLLKQALESKHNKFWEKSYTSFLNSYKSKSNNFKEIISRLEQVESRGRNKKK